MLCFNRWAGWRLLGCKTGKRNLHRVVLNWMLIKFMDIHWPRQTRQIQTCLHTLIIHPTDQRGSIYPPRGSSRLFSLPYSSTSFTYQFCTEAHICTHIYTRTSTYTYICMDSYITQRFYIFSKIPIFPNSVPSLHLVLSISSHSRPIRITKKYIVFNSI